MNIPQLQASLRILALPLLAAVGWPSQGRPELPPRPAQHPSSDEVSRALVRTTPLLGERPALFFDEAGDGSLWVRGEGYKARFGTDAVEFVPFLGSRAPRNFPLRLSLESARLDGVELPLLRDVRPVRMGEEQRVVSYDRGSVIEHYVVGLDAIEQRFQVDRALADAAGDLVVRVAVESELELSERPDGFRFEGPLGGVHYGRALVLDGTGRVYDSPTALVDGAIEIRVPRSVLASTDGPLTIDPMITPFSIEDSTARTDDPDVAFDETHQRYAVVWEHEFSQMDRDVWLQMHNVVGSVLPGTGAWIDFTAADVFAPNVANNGNSDQFLVVAMEQVGSEVQVSGRTRQAASTSMGSLFRISGSEPGLKVFPDVGGDPVPVGPSYYCVTWLRLFNGSETDVEARLVSPAGQLFGPGTLLVDSAPGTLDQDLAISKQNGRAPFDTQRWTIAWSRDAGGQGDLYAAQLTWDGLIAQPTFPIDTSPRDDRQASVSSVMDAASGDRRYLVTWKGAESGFESSDIYVRLFAGSAALTPVTNLHSIEGVGNLGPGFVQRQPYASCDGSTLMVAYSEIDTSGSNSYDVFVSELDFDGGQLICSDPHASAGGTTGSEGFPRLASRTAGEATANGYLSVWRLIESGDYDVAGATVAPLTVGHVFCETLPNSTGFRGHLTIAGSRSVARDDLILYATRCPANAPGLFFYGSSQVDLPFGSGRRCVGGTLKRMPITSTNSSGIAFRSIDFSAPYATGIVAGAPGVNYQFWYRDNTHTGNSNTTDAVHIEHLP